VLGLIIFGRRTMTKTNHSGSFRCPGCGPDQTYVHKEVKRWFTLYFIPIIPLGTVGAYIQCTRCHGQFTEDVLHYLPPDTPNWQK
jgi:hypothetical protein